MPKFPIDNGFTIHTFPPPPPGFDPDHASDRDKLAYGYPACAAQFPDLVARWKSKLSVKGYKFIQPEFKPRVAPRKAVPKIDPHGPQTTGNWAGAVVTPSAGKTFKWVESNWRFPQSYLPSGTVDNILYTASTWIGIDGVNSPDIMQAGCDSDIQTNGTSPSHQYNPWWEWFPAGSFWITNLSFSPGDEISMLICITEGSNTSAAVFFSNETKNTGGFFHATAPAGTTVQGTSAEWIVEALGSSIGFALAKFDTVEFTDCYAGFTGGGSVDSGTGSLINMSNGTGKATASLVGSTGVQIVYG